MSWCPRCGRSLSNLTTGGHGVCPQHGRVAADFHAPCVVLSDDGPLGRYIRADADSLVYESGGEQRISVNCADVVPWADLRDEW